MNDYGSTARIWSSNEIPATGIGAKRIKRIVSSYNDRISARRVMDFFIQHGFGIL